MISAGFTRYKSAVYALLFWIVILLCPGLIPRLYAQEAQIGAPAYGPARGWSGVIQVSRGAEVPIYVVEILDNNAFGPGFNQVLLGDPLGILGINIKIRDLLVSTGLNTADFAGLNLYRSTTATLDGSEVLLIGSVAVAAVGVGAALDGVGNTTLDATGAPVGNRTIADGGSAFFIITASIAASAGGGHSFTVQTDLAAGHIGVDETFFAGNTLGGPPNITYDGATYIVIAADTPNASSSLGGSIPFGGEGAILVLLIGTGLYMIRRHLPRS
jgi:hypothetical protein